MSTPCPPPKVALGTEEAKAPLDLSHYYSRVTKNRIESRMKEFYKYFMIPGIGNLAGGLPNASYFPYDTLEATVALPDRFKPTPNPDEGLEKKLATVKVSDSKASSHVVVPHESSSTNPLTKIDLTTALQYGQAQGYPPLLSFLRQFARENMHPNIPYKDGPEVILTNGSTDGFGKALECLSNTWSQERDWVKEREGILCEEFAYMNAIQAATPRGLNVTPVKIDDEGMLASGPGGLQDVLENWDTSKGKRPHLMYTVTIGQNPTSGTLSVPRRKEIYALCSKYDVIIIEDDPYWYLQFPSAARLEASARNLVPPPPPSNVFSAYPYTKTKSSGYPFLDSLIPSYLSVDTEGRVVRLDTFSKTVAPGCRLGWITAQPAIVERILRITETSTQQPSGFVQAMIAELVMGPDQAKSKSKSGGKNGGGWQVGGWVRWLEGLRGEYERRMNLMCTALEARRELVKHQRFAPSSSPTSDDDDDWAVLSKVEMYDFTWPRGGMFVWLKFNFPSHPLWGKVEAARLFQALWVWLTRKPFLVLAAPGVMFSPTEGIKAEEGWKHMRLCFAAVSDEEVQKASERFAQGVEAFWRLKKESDLDGIEAMAERIEGSVSEEATNLGGFGGAWVC